MRLLLQIGPRDPKVLPFDHALRLGLLWVVLAVLAVIASAVALRIRSRRPA